MEIGARELSSRTAHVIDAVRAGERVTLTVDGVAVADIVPRSRRTRWLVGAQLREKLLRQSPDAGLPAMLDELAGQTLDQV